jgi:predicted NBD/HSP70 family sugar kinase
MVADRPSLVRNVSRQRVAEALLEHATLSRADMARITGLSKQTMSQVIAELEDGGLVRSVGTTRGAIGRTAVTYEFARDSAYALGVDLGGSKATAALANLVGDVVAETTTSTNPRGGEAVVRQIHALAQTLAASHAIDPKRIQSLVVGTPGVVDPASGAIRLVPNIKGLSEFDVRKALADLFGRTVVIENDVNLAVLGEAWKGCARGAENAAFLALGTGVGLGLIVNGKLARGASGAAGEIAYLPIGADLISPEALDVGAFELEAGSLGILRRYRAHGGEAGSVRELFARLADGDAIAARVLDEIAALIAQAITVVLAIVDPEIVVLGGSIGIQPALLERVRAATKTLFARPVRIEASALDDRAGLVGALSSAVNRLHNDLFGIPNLPGELSSPAPEFERAAQ